MQCLLGRKKLVKRSCQRVFYKKSTNSPLFFFHTFLTLLTLSAVFSSTYASTEISNYFTLPNTLTNPKMENASIANENIQNINERNLNETFLPTIAFEKKSQLLRNDLDQPSVTVIRSNVCTGATCAYNSLCVDTSDGMTFLRGRSQLALEANPPYSKCRLPSRIRESQICSRYLTCMDHEVFLWNRSPRVIKSVNHETFLWNRNPRVSSHVPQKALYSHTVHISKKQQRKMFYKRGEKKVHLDVEKYILYFLLFICILLFETIHLFGTNLPTPFACRKRTFHRQRKKIKLKIKRRKAKYFERKRARKKKTKLILRDFYRKKAKSKEKLKMLVKKEAKISMKTSEKKITSFVNNVPVQINSVINDNKIILIPKIKKNNFYMLLDSGAEVSVASEETYRKWKRKGLINIENSQAQIINIHDAQYGELRQTRQPVTVNLNFNGKVIPQIFYVVERLSNTLLGVDFMKNNEISLHCRKKTVHIEFSQDTKTPHFKGYYPSTLFLHSAYTSFLKPGINELDIEAPFPERTVLHIQSILPDNHPIQFYEGIARVEDSEVRLVFYNKSDVNFPIVDLSKIVQATPLESNVVVSRVSISSTTENGLQEKLESETYDFKEILEPEVEEDENLEPKGIEIDLDQNHPPVDVEYHVKRLFPEQFHEIMIEFFTNECPDLIAQHSYDSGTLREDILVIDNFNMKPGSKVRCKPLKLDHVRQQQLNRALDIMVKAGILVKGVSSTYSPAFIISKADGRIRVVISYVEFNKCIEPLNYAIPDTKQVLLEIGKEGPEFMSTIDFSAAYSAVKVTGEASKQAAICTMTDTYLLQKLLFGISTSPGMFNYAISKIVDTIDQSQHRFVSHFFDDLTIYSSDWPEENLSKEEIHLNCIKKVLTAVYKAGMKIRLDKCSFFKQEISILGRIISKQGISPQPKTITAIKQLQPPTTLKQLQSLIGALIWASPFILNFSYYMEPIFQLLQKESNLEWGESQENALEHFKNVLTTRCIQYWPDYSRKLYIAADASANAVGACIYQTRTLPRDFDRLRDEFIGNEPLSEKDKADIAVLPKPGSRCPQVFVLNRYDDQLTPYTEQNIPLVVDDDPKNSDAIHVCLPLAFHSQSLGKTRSKWPIMEKECYSVLSVIEKFESLIEGFKEVYILSDSAPFLYVAKGSTAGTKKLQRWICRLSQYPFKIFCCSLSSKQNVMADLLSRNIFWHITENENEEKFHGKKLLVKSPFPFNSTITIQDIINALKQNPNCVYKYEEHNPVEIRSVFVNFSGTNVVEDLTKEFTDYNLTRSQENDLYCIEIKNNLKKHKEFYVYNDILFKKRVKTDSVHQRGRVVLTEKNVTPCIVRYHYDNHCGINELFKSINKTYFYPGLMTKIVELIAACHLCALYKGHPSNQKIRDLPFWPVKRNYVWHADVTGGFPKVNGYKSIICLQEYYTKYKIFHPLRNETAEEISYVIEHQVFKIFNPCKFLSTDNAMNLVKSIKMQQVLKKYGVLPHLMTAYHPESHGVIEICCKAVQTLLRIINDRYRDQWPYLLGLTQILLNNKKTEVLGWRSPQKCMFGYDADIESPLKEQESKYPDYNRLEDEFQQQKIELDQIITQWQKERDKRNRKYLGKFRSYPPGSFVYVRDQRKGGKRKLRSRFWKAPLLVLSEFDSVLLVKSFQGVTYSVHKSNCYKMASFRKEAYDSLPANVKSNLGIAFTNKELERLMEENEIPQLFRSREWQRLPRATIEFEQPDAVDISVADPLDDPYYFENATSDQSILNPVDEDDLQYFPIQPVANSENERVYLADEPRSESNSIIQAPEVDIFDQSDFLNNDQGSFSNHELQPIPEENLADVLDEETPLESRSSRYSLRKNPQPKKQFNLL